MGRNVIVEAIIEESILGLFGKTKWATGILIGQSTQQRDYVVHIAWTPSQPSVDDSDTKPPNNEFDEEWFVQHCRQVNSMLVGGLNILGIFIFGPTEVRSKLQAKFRQTLYAVQKFLSNDLPLTKWNLQEHSKAVLFHVCCNTKKTTCYNIDVSDNKANMEPAEFKYQKFISKWIEVKSTINLEWDFILQRKGKNRFSDMKAAVMPKLLNISKSLATLDGVITKEEQSLVMDKPKGNSRSEKSLPRTIQLYIKKDECEPDINKCSGQRTMLFGKIETMAYLNAKSTVKDAINAIKCDIIRSVLARLRLLCEDLDETYKSEKEDVMDETENKPLVMLELPRRIFSPMCRGHIHFSDYVFKYENIEDVLNRILELLGASVDQNDLLFPESFPDEKINLLDCFDDESATPNVDDKSDEIKSNKSFQIIGASFGVITVLMATIYKWFIDE